MVCQFLFGLFVARPQILSCVIEDRTSLDPESGRGAQVGLRPCQRRHSILEAAGGGPAWADDKPVSQLSGNQEENFLN